MKMSESRGSKRHRLRSAVLKGCKVHVQLLQRIAGWVPPQSLPALRRTSAAFYRATQLRLAEARPSLESTGRASSAKCRTQTWPPRWPPTWKHAVWLSAWAFSFAFPL